MNKRLRMVYLSRLALYGFLTLDGGTRVEVTGMPSDGNVVGVYFDPYHDRVCIMVESQDFAEVLDGAPVPELELACRSFTEAPYRGREFI